jgi:hypothetical protein
MYFNISRLIYPEALYKFTKPPNVTNPELEKIDAELRKFTGSAKICVATDITAYCEL